MRSNERPLKKKISITIDENVYELVVQKAAEEERSVSSYINRAMHYYMLSEKNMDKKFT